MNAIISIHINQSNNNAMDVLLRLANGTCDGIGVIAIRLKWIKGGVHAITLETDGYETSHTFYPNLQLANRAFNRRMKKYNATEEEVVRLTDEA